RPSLKYSWPGSPLRFWKGSTASVTGFGGRGDGTARYAARPKGAKARAIALKARHGFSGALPPAKATILLAGPCGFRDPLPGMGAAAASANRPSMGAMNR